MKWLSRCLSVLLAGLFAGLAAFWWAQLRVPAPPLLAVTPPDPRPTLDIAAQGRLFGQSTVVFAPLAQTNIRLGGVIAPGQQKGQGIAVLALEQKPMRAYRTGDALVPGMTLAEVRFDRIVIEQNGLRSEIELPKAQRLALQRNNPAPSPSAPSTTPSADAQNSGKPTN